MIAFDSLSTRRFLKLKRGSLKETLATRFPYIYLGLVTMLAIAGYACLLLFPILILAGIINIYQAVFSSQAVGWLSALFWLVVVVVAGVVCFRSTQVKPTLPAGLTLTEEKAPRLFSLVKELRNHYKRIPVQRIVITSKYELDIVRTPGWPLPVFMSNTLVIGLPVMLCLSPKQFECMLARRIGQFSGRYNRLTNWLYQLRAIWEQYRVFYGRQTGTGIEPFRWFFSVYAPLYTIASTWAARKDELKADTYAMELYNDEEVREMITADSLCRFYLQYRFWPAIYKLSSTDSKTMPTPHARMAAAVYGSLTGDNLQALMPKVLRHRPSASDTVPSLQARIENIGHDKARMGKPASEVAAAHYLGASTNAVIQLIDKLWLQTYLQKRKRRVQQGHT